MLSGRFHPADAVRRAETEARPRNQLLGVSRPIYVRHAVEGKENPRRLSQDERRQPGLPLRQRQGMRRVYPPPVGLPHVPAGHGRTEESRASRAKIFYCGECSKMCPRKANPGESMMAMRRYLTAQYDWTGLARLMY